MSAEDTRLRRDSTRIVLDPPTFSPPPEMRREYLARHKAELEAILEAARAGDWKPAVKVANNVRGTGAMYGFPNMGNAAEELNKAVQNGDSESLGYLEKYVEAVNASYV